jgi:hypothetical protein
MLDRLYAIKRPLEYQTTLLRHNVSKSIAVCWLLALVPTIPLWFDSTIEKDCDWTAGPDGKSIFRCFFPLNNVRKPDSPEFVPTFICAPCRRSGSGGRHRLVSSFQLS